jgi:opacity protein-like surface antigen
VISSGLDTSPLVALGGGVEYLVARNIAIGLEAKQRLWFDTEFEVAGQTRELDLDSTVWSAGLRIYLDGEEGSGRGLPPADSDALRGYLALRAGGAVFTSRDDSLGVELVSPAAPAGSATVGLNLDKHWGLEIALDTVETDLDAVDTPGIKRLGEYTMLAGTAQVRLRYPVMEDRLVPYLLAGGGVGFGEFNDRVNPVEQFDVGDKRSFVGLGVVGGGFDYFLADNVAIGVEAKHLFLFESEIEIDRQPRGLDLDSVLLTAGIRIFFP